MSGPGARVGVPGEGLTEPAPARALSDPPLVAYAAALAAEPKAKVPLDRCRELLAALPGGAPLGDPDPRRVLAESLRALAEAGAIRLPSPRSKTGWDREREPPLPRVVVVPRQPRPRSAPLEAALHPVLARARDRAIGVRLPADLPAIDAWLKAHGASAPELPLQERSYEIFGDEKRLDAFLRTTFATRGGIEPAALRAYRVVEPFAMTAFDERSEWAVAIENLATYDSTCRAVAALPPEAARPAAVIFGRGMQFVTSCASLPTRLPTVGTLIYFGDLDPTGLEIPLAAKAALARAGVRVAPWVEAYRALLERSPTSVSKGASLADSRRLAAFLPSPLDEAVRAVLCRPSRVAQEALTRVDLAALLAAWDCGARTRGTACSRD